MNHNSDYSVLRCPHCFRRVMLKRGHICPSCSRTAFRSGTEKEAEEFEKTRENDARRSRAGRRLRVVVFATVFLVGCLSHLMQNAFLFLPTFLAVRPLWVKSRKMIAADARNMMSSDPLCHTELGGHLKSYRAAA